jgi:hypothetical protein
MPVPVAIYDATTRNTMANLVIDAMTNANTPATHVVYLAFNLSQQGYRVGTALATNSIDTYASEEAILLTGPVVGDPISEADRSAIHQSLLGSIEELIQQYGDSPGGPL